MFNKLTAISAIVIASYTSPVLALGVGSIDMHSSMNQPLDATIDLYGTEGMGNSQLLAKLGSLQDFERAGVIWEYFLNDIKFTVEIDQKGGGVIRLSTDNPVVEPYINFVLDIRWPDGRILREYTALIDFMPIEQGEAVSKSLSDVAEANSESSSGNPQEEQAEQAGQWRVKSGDTLWDIALQTRPNRAYSPQQTMQAIVENNPRAFEAGNINGLKAGAVLVLPNESQIANIPKAGALLWVRRQNNGWLVGDPLNDEPNSVNTSDAINNKALNQANIGDDEAYLRLARADTKVLPSPGESPSDTFEQNTAVKSDAVQSADQSSGETILPEEANDLTERLVTTLEDLDRSNRQNEELTARFAALEEQVQTMQRLMLLKDQQLSKIQAASESDSAASFWQTPAFVTGLGTSLLGLLGWVFWLRRKNGSQKQHESELAELIEPIVLIDQQDNEQQGAEKQAKAATGDRDLSNTSPSDTNANGLGDLTSSSDNQFSEELEDTGSLIALANDKDPVEEALVEIDIYKAYGRLSKAYELIRALHAKHQFNPLVQLKLLELSAGIGETELYTDLISQLEESSDSIVKDGLLKLRSEYPGIFGEDDTALDLPDEHTDNRTAGYAPKDNIEHVSSDDADDDHLQWDIGLDSKDQDHLEQQALEEDLLVASAEILSTDKAISQQMPSDPVPDTMSVVNADLDLSLDDSSPIMSTSDDLTDHLPDDLVLDQSSLENADLAQEDAELTLDEGALAFDSDSSGLALGDLDVAEEGLSNSGNLDNQELKQQSPPSSIGSSDQPSNADDLADLDDLEGMDFSGLDEITNLAGLDKVDADYDLSDLSLDDDDFSLDEMMNAAFASENSLDGSLSDSQIDSVDQNEGSDVIQAKLDMAKTFIEMGEKDDAQVMLDDVLRDGNAIQQQEAKDLKEKFS